jgi:beta-glucosidase
VQRFPHGFLWGAATAAHQIEGNNVHNDWWRAEEAGLMPHRSLDACDSWNRWADDIQLLQDMGLNAYRLSVEWARVEPEPGRFDQTALDTYRRLLEALRTAGIEPLVTLHHCTSPAWLGAGWADPQVAPRFAEYANRVARSVGDLVQWWVTINEPSILGLKAYIEGSWPPHRPWDLRGYVRLMRHSARAHVMARRALKAHRPDAMVSQAFAIWPMQPARWWSPIDQLMARLGDWLWQARPLHRTLPTLDWIGLNYYSRNVVGWPWPRADARATTGVKRTDFGWEIYPAGLYAVLRRIGRYGKPIVITENGVADAADELRADYILAHLQQAYRAISDGVDLRGYMHWSLLDNFEWSEGYTQRFGLATRERVLRPSAAIYGAIARANALP